ncbi:hypothetical protein NBRC116592_18400 [Colwellia sp. KU-HH00111]|uniref:CYTH domain-containing protein n=1 Tax=Colwellia sp. KU-HH00111 TaxID=3127652 RepID=UPI003106E283
MSTEIELKYQLLSHSDSNNTVGYEPIIAEISALLKEHKLLFEMHKSELFNDYYESDDLTLRKMEVGLRIRQKGQLFVQTIKTAGKVEGCLHQRPEFNIDIPSNQLNLSLFDQAIWPENTDVALLEKQLKVVFSTNFVRQTWLIHQDESVIELALDEGEIMTKAGQPSVAINELEIELVRGSEQALFDLAELLKTVVNMEPSGLSKAARGYALYQQQLGSTTLENSK